MNATSITCRLTHALCRGAASLWVGGSLLLAVPAFAQLDASCTVSVLNRSIPVAADGVWVLPNVPANQGLVRARATCVAGGVSRSGQSEFFAIPADGVIQVADIRFDAPAPIPVAIELTAARTVLSAAGETLQLRATSRLPDGSAVDVTAAGGATGYLSSNARIAEVDAGGLVTARVSGVALISAVYEGAVSILRVEVALSGDADGDGLADDFELANGLDPNNPSDAFDDLDGDGLATRDEVAAGLDPLKADTDGDRLADGAEVNGFHTNPLLRDTDGDRVSDGLEVLAGSDPLDAQSIQLGPIVEEVAVQPGALTLIFNTVMGEAARRLDVTARLLDGTRIDVRSRRYGTTYSSSDLAIASFGAEDGMVFAGQSGTATVTVRLGSRSAETAVTVETFAPTALSFLALSGFANGVDVAGDVAYVASGEAGLHLVDVSDLQAPVLMATVNTRGNANDVRVRDGFAYVADGWHGLVVVDVTDPGRPRIAGRVDTPGDATDLAVRGDFVYVADGPAGLQVIDATDRSAPVLLSGLDTPGLARGVDVSGDLVVVADGFGGVHVIGAADPFDLALLGSTHTRGDESRAADVAVRGRLAWVADGAFAVGGLKLVDLSDPALPVVVGRTPDAFALVGVALDRGAVLAADFLLANTLPVFSPAGPAFTAGLDFAGAPSFRTDNGNGVAVRSDGAVFLAASRSLRADNGDSGESGLHIGRYRLGGDELGVAPEVEITAPAAGASAPERTSLTVRAQASDDVHLEAVRFLVDGVEVARDVKAPWEAVVRVPVGAPLFRVSAVAEDTGGNQGTDEVIVGVIPDTRPAVTVSHGDRLREGTKGVISVFATDDLGVERVEIFLNGVSMESFAFPPYRVVFTVPRAPGPVNVRAVATDSVGQTTTVAAAWPIDADPPPFVGVIVPPAGARTVGGARLAVTVGASDAQGVRRVELLANGVPVGEDLEEPYLFTVEIPEGLAELRLTARAEDEAGQVSTAERILDVLAADPLTTAEGRVVSLAGEGVEGATVRCGAAAGISLADGRFSLAGLPTLEGSILCTASLEAGDGRRLTGSSPALEVVAGGVTPLGSVVLHGSRLYVGAGGYTSFGEGRLYRRDDVESRLIGVSEPLLPEGFSGLTFGPDGSLFATLYSTDFATIAARSVREYEKDVVRLDPETGAELERIGPFARLDGREIQGLQDIVYAPSRGRFYALEGGFYADQRIFELDLATRVARPVVEGLIFDVAGLAIDPAGRLVLVRGMGRSRMDLLRLDPATGTLLSVEPVVLPPGFPPEINSPQAAALVLDPGTLRFLLTFRAMGDVLFELDPATLQVRRVGVLEGLVTGDLEGMAFLPD